MEGEATSVYLLVNYDADPSKSGLYEVKIDQRGHLLEIDDKPLWPVYTFFDKNHEVPDFFHLTGARFSSDSKLYLSITDLLIRDETNSCKAESCSGYIFDTKIGSLEPFRPPQNYKPGGTLISAYGKLYYLADPMYCSRIPEPSFECYDPNESWKPLPSLPHSRHRDKQEITGYAVCYGCILVSMGCHGRYELMLFHLNTEQWHPVTICRDDNDFEDGYDNAFQGRAVVVDNIIYALSIRHGKVIAFSLKMDSKDDGHIIFSVYVPFVLQGLKSWLNDWLENFDYTPSGRKSEYLVHLGNMKFCLFQTLSGYVKNGRQHMWITTFQIVHDKEMHIKTLSSVVRQVDIAGYGQFLIGFSFTPECKDFEPKVEEFIQQAKLKTFDSVAGDVCTNGHGTYKRECENIERKEEETCQFRKKGTPQNIGGRNKRIISPRMHEEEATSVYLLANHITAPSRSGLYEVKIDQLGQIMAIDDKPLRPVHTFFDKSLTVPDMFHLTGARFYSKSKLYLFLCDELEGSSLNGTNNCKAESCSGYVFDTQFGSLEPFMPPKVYKPGGTLISAYGKLYYLADPLYYSRIPKPSFESYNPRKNSWRALPSLPYSKRRAGQEITGYAVCFGCIFVCVGCRGKHFEFMAFHVTSRKWHPVTLCRPDGYIDDGYANTISGRAVVVGNTIFALSMTYGKIIGFSLKMDSEEDGSTIYSLEVPFLLPGLESGFNEWLNDFDFPPPGRQTEYLVHLGKLKFCLFQALSDNVQYGCQRLWITTFQIVHEKDMHIKTLDSVLRHVVIEPCDAFYICFGFTPECKDFEPKEQTYQLATGKGIDRKRNRKNNTLDSNAHDVGIDGSGRLLTPYASPFSKERKMLTVRKPCSYEFILLAAVLSTVLIFCIIPGFSNSLGAYGQKY